MGEKGVYSSYTYFISGLIILFERPIRIGDRVTVNNVSGTVRRIRIRATTLIDSERRDIIIPNKVFITGQLTNWSLTDTVTRITLRINVAHGSDLAKTKELLLQAARENTRIMKDPAPVVYFLGFAATTLDHELRAYVELGDRNPAIDEVNRRIDQLLTENGIKLV